LKRVRFAFFRIEEKQIRFAFASHFFSKKISLSHSTFRENLDPWKDHQAIIPQGSPSPVLGPSAPANRPSSASAIFLRHSHYF
jgi:hypothetical protein